MAEMVSKQYDIVIVGGGFSGVCAAIAGARHGAQVALIQNRPVLGGNGSSEVRMHVCGADYHATRPDARETGILEEIMLENKRKNPQYSFSIFDTVLWEMTHFQAGLDLFLNSHLTEVTMQENRIIKIKVIQLTTEKVLEFEAPLFVDTTGDATLAFLAGAEYMIGREGKDVFGETDAPDHSDHYTMGSSLLFRAVDLGKPVPFEKPWWANSYTEADLQYRLHQDPSFGFWWVELGGGEWEIIADDDKIRDELLKAAYGVWDHLKNGGDHQADNYALDWVGFLPGKRESRRIVGDYILKESDLLAGMIFPDAVAYGGWPIDLHVPEGIRNLAAEPTQYIHLKDLYTIPYRCLYSKNIANLMVGGRAISASHNAFGSSRIMATCALVGQAIGTAAALAIAKRLSPRDLSNNIQELQQQLLKDDCYIPGFKNEDPSDLARSAKVACSSETADGVAPNVLNGVNRKVKEQSNCWISKEIKEDGEWLALEFDAPIQPREVRLTFDSNLNRMIMMTNQRNHLERQLAGVPPELIKDYRLEFYRGSELVHAEMIAGNYQRLRVHSLPQGLRCDRLKIQVLATHGDKQARIFEVRVY
jgi:hypothetical protein